TPLRSPSFPYTTLFRSRYNPQHRCEDVAVIASKRSPHSIYRMGEWQEVSDRLESTADHIEPKPGSAKPGRDIDEDCKNRADLPIGEKSSEEQAECDIKK